MSTENSAFVLCLQNLYSFVSVGASVAHYIFNVLFTIQLYKNEEMSLFITAIIIFVTAFFVVFWCFRMDMLRTKSDKGYEGECNFGYFCCGCDARYFWPIHFCFAIPFFSILTYLDHQTGAVSNLFEALGIRSNHQKHKNAQNDNDNLLRCIDELIQSHKLYKIECIVFNIPFTIIQYIFIINYGYTHKSFIGFLIGLFVIGWKLLLFNIRSFDIGCILFHWICFNFDFLIFAVNILWIYHIINYSHSPYIYILIIILFIAMSVRILFIAIPKSVTYVSENIFHPIKDSFNKNNMSAQINNPNTYFRFIRQIDDMPDIALYPRCIIPFPRRKYNELRVGALGPRGYFNPNNRQSALNNPPNIIEKILVVLMFSIYIPIIFFIRVCMEYVKCFSYILYYIEIFDYDYSLNKAGVQRMIWEWFLYSNPNLSQYAQTHSRNGWFYYYSTAYFYNNFVRIINKENKKDSTQYMNIHRRLMVINYSFPRSQKNDIRDAQIFDYDRLELNDLVNDMFEARNCDEEHINYTHYRCEFLKFIDKRRACKEIKGFKGTEKQKKTNRYVIMAMITLFVTNILFPFLCLCINGSEGLNVNIEFEYFKKLNGNEINLYLSCVFTMIVFCFYIPTIIILSLHWIIVQYIFYYIVKDEKQRTYNIYSLSLRLDMNETLQQHYYTAIRNDILKEFFGERVSYVILQYLPIMRDLKIQDYMNDTVSKEAKERNDVEMNDRIENYAD
eukprot:337091_1